MDISEARNRFVDDFTEIAAHVFGVDLDTIDQVKHNYIKLFVSQCMDASILHAQMLDIGYDDGYRIMLKKVG